jgi:hypothetical protein
MIFKFLISLILFLLIQLPAILLSYPAVAILLLTKWKGSSSWFGNELYPSGVGSSHQVADPNYGQKWYFLCVRNPVSNLGKWTFPKGLGAPIKASWPWLYNQKLIFGIYVKFGWAAENDDRIVNGSRKFYFRFWRP